MSSLCVFKFELVCIFFIDKEIDFVPDEERVLLYYCYNINDKYRSIYISQFSFA